MGKPPSDSTGDLLMSAARLIRRIEDLRGQAAEHVLDGLGDRDRRTLDRILTRWGEQP